MSKYSRGRKLSAEFHQPAHNYDMKDSNSEEFRASSETAFGYFCSDRELSESDSTDCDRAELS